METLRFDYHGGTPVAASTAPVLVGVVGSGNLEVLVEAQDLSGACRIEILTAAVGYAATWQAVLDDFFARHRLADLRIAINDVGSTPAVVSLRLEQAVAAFVGAAP